MFGMERYLLLIQIFISGTLGDHISEFLDKLESTNSTDESADAKLHFILGDDSGRQEKIEIHAKDIPKANLSTLTDWLSWSDDLKSVLRQIKENSDDCEVYSGAAPFGRDKKDDMPIPDRIDRTIAMVEEYEQKIELELRKPDKDWNYSPEKVLEIGDADDDGSE